MTKIADLALSASRIRPWSSAYFTSHLPRARATSRARTLLLRLPPSTSGTSRSQSRRGVLSSPSCSSHRNLPASRPAARDSARAPFQIVSTPNGSSPSCSPTKSPLGSPRASWRHIETDSALLSIGHHGQTSLSTGATEPAPVGTRSPFFTRHRVHHFPWGSTRPDEKCSWVKVSDLLPVAYWREQGAEGPGVDPHATGARR